MATNLHLSTVGVDLALNAVLDVLNSGTINIYDGAQPTDCDTAVTTQHLLATLTLSATAFGAAAAGSKTANAIGNGTGLSAHSATWFRAFKSDGTTAVIDGTVNTATSDMVISAVAIGIGDTVSCSSWVVSFAK